MFYDVSVEEPEDGKFTRSDLEPYRKLLTDLKPGQIATITVDTGDVYTAKLGNRRIQRGREEATDERNFRKVAAEMGVGLRVTHKLQQGGTTRLRIMKQPKREFSAETMAKRQAALERRRAEQAAKKVGQQARQQQPQQRPPQPQKRNG